MKEYLKSWIPRIKGITIELDSLGWINNDPWIIIDGSEETVRLVFKPNGKLLASKNGLVSEGTWEFLSSGKTVLLDFFGEKRLYVIEFFDQGLMILYIDGQENNKITLANQEVIADLDVEFYLRSHYPEQDGTRWKVINSKLKDGRDLVISSHPKHPKYHISSHVFIDKVPASEFVFWTQTPPRRYIVKNGYVEKIYLVERVQLRFGKTLELETDIETGSRIGCEARLDGKPAPSGNYKTGMFSRVQVKDGKCLT